MKTSIIFVIALMALASVALATPSPNGPGQPGLECGAAGAELSPNGFNTAGFAHAETVYAGSGVSLLHANSPHAVSQYDVACFQVTQHQH